ncbi:MAG TPA: Hsp20/alpha crystallin family protein [Longimicrobiales bacterium]|nr:Hsp20/alpha crystallin family protein [Longimicrobiales bacterium]
MLLQQRNRGAAFSTLNEMTRELDRLMNGPMGVNANGPWGLPAEVVETDDEIRIDIEAPGFREEDLEITLENNVLTVSGEKQMRRSENVKDSDYRLVERRYGRFQRSFTVPATVRTSACEASYEHGVLTLRLPKAEEAKPRRIQISRGQGGRQIEDGTQTES